MRGTVVTRAFPLALAAVSSFVLSSSSVFAGWPHESTVNLPVCTAPFEQVFPAIAPDGAGGAFITWSDYRSGTNGDIYAQHVLASGVADPTWPSNGSAIGHGASEQRDPALVSDGADGVIVVWRDQYAVYAQHVLADGAIDPAWPADGLALCLGAARQLFYPKIVSDGGGGAIVVWWGYVNGTYSVLYAQHVLASGEVDAAWPADGRVISATASGGNTHALTSDGAGGAIVAWRDERFGTGVIYAQHVLAGGMDPAWPVDGRALSTTANRQGSPTIASDGAGGAIVAWRDYRTGIADIYAQHVLASGMVDPAWPANGAAICTAAGQQYNAALIPDGAGGAIVTWDDYRCGINCGEIYAQHLLADGSVDPAWPGNGSLICTAEGNREYPAIVSDGTGGAIITWQDWRLGGDIYAQRVLAGGAIDPSWPFDGLAISAAINEQWWPSIISDGSTGAIITWMDNRNDRDIYAQKVTASGKLGESALRVVLDLDPDVIELSSQGRWVTAYIEPIDFEPTTVDISTIRLASSVPAEAKFASVGDHDGDEARDLMVKFSRQALAPLLAVGVNQLEVTGRLVTGEPFAGIGGITVMDSGTNALSLQLVSPLGATPVQFTIRDPGTASHRMAVYDIQGRLLRVWSGPVSKDPLSWDGRGDGELVGSGVYFIRVTEGVREATLKVVLAR